MPYLNWKQLIEFLLVVECKNIIIIGVAPFTQVTHMHNKNSNTQGRLLNVISDFPYYK